MSWYYQVTITQARYGGVYEGKRGLKTQVLGWQLMKNVLN